MLANIFPTFKIMGNILDINIRIEIHSLLVSIQSFYIHCHSTLCYGNSFQVLLLSIGNSNAASQSASSFATYTLLSAFGWDRRPQSFLSDNTCFC